MLFRFGIRSNQKYWSVKRCRPILQRCFILTVSGYRRQILWTRSRNQWICTNVKKVKVSYPYSTFPQIFHGIKGTLQ